MRAIILLVAAGLAVAVHIEETVYTPGHDYVHSYETQVLSGVPHHGQQVSGVRIRCDVRVQFKTKTRALMRLENIKVFSILGKLADPWPADGLVPETLLAPIETSVLATLTGELIKPVKFDYIVGNVQNVKMQVDEPIWSINIKKAIVASLKVNLNRANEIRTTAEPLFADVMPDFSNWATGATTSVYKVMEAGISGVCESAYSVMPDATTPAMLKVTKVKNYDNCAMAPVYEQGLLSGLTFIPEPISIKDMIQKSSHADYTVAGSASGFVIHAARIDSRYIMTPMTPEDGNAVTTIIQTLTLTAAVPTTTDITPVGRMDVRPNGIVYEWPTVALTKSKTLDFEGHFGWADMHMATGDKIAIIDRILEQAIPKIHPIVTKPVLVELERVTGLMKTLTVEELTTLCTKYTDADFTKREIILDLLPTLVTPKVMPVLVHLITNNLISTTRAVISMKLAALTITPTYQTIKLISPASEAFLQHPAVTSRPVLYHTIVLNGGTILRRFITMAQKHGITRAEIEAALLPDVQAGMRIVERPNTPLSTQIVYIKAMANTGIASFLPVIEKTIMDKSKSPILRRNAIASAARMPSIFFPKIQKMLLPVYMDMTDDRQVREAAFISLIDTIPEPAVLHMIARTQRSEKSFSMAKLVYTYLCNVARMTLPGLETLAMNVRRILPLVKPVSTPAELMMWGSQNFYFDTNCANKEMCMGMDILKSASAAEMRPSVIQARVYVHMLGKTITPIEANIWESGFAPILNKLFGVWSTFRGTLTDKPLTEIIKTLLAPVSSFPVNIGAVADEIKVIITKLGITERPIAENLHLGVVLKIFGNEITFVDITEEAIMNIVTKGELPIIGDVTSFITKLKTTGITLDIPKVLSLGTSSIQIPTPAGVPLFVNITGIAVSHLKTVVSPVSVGIVDAMKYGVTGAPANVAVNTITKTSTAVHISGFMGVDLSVMATGIAVKATAITNLNFGMDTTMNTVTSKITVTMTPTSVGTEIINAEINSNVFMYTLPPAVSTPPTFKAIEIWHPERFELINIKSRNTIPFTGAVIDTVIRTPVTLPRWMPVSWIWAKKSVVITMAHSEPVEITMEYSPSWNTFTVDPAIASPKVWRMATTVGSKTWPVTRRAQLAINLAVGDDGFMIHYNIMAMFPGIMPEPVTINTVWNLRRLSVFREPAMTPVTPIPNLCHSTITMGVHKMDVKVIATATNDLNVTPVVNSALTTLLKLYMGTDASITKERIARTETPIVIKMIVEPTSIDMAALKWYGAGVYAAVYGVMGFPSLPKIEMRPVTVPTSAVESHFVIYPVLQRVICVTRTPARKEYVVEIPWTLWPRPAGKLISVEAPWVITAPPAAGTPPFGRVTEVVTSTCTVSPVAAGNADTVTTFDYARYTVPALTKSCEVVLARDCSSAGLFTVLTAGVGAAKTVKIMSFNHKVEIRPVTSWAFGTEVDVEVDGRMITVTDIAPVIITDNGAPTGNAIAKVTKTANWINVAIWKIGLIVSTDTKNVVVKAGPFYKGYLCGLCGNSNFDMADDYMGPSMTIHPTAANMIMKYVVPTATCSAEEVRNILGVTANPSAICTPVARTGYVTYNGLTCFTKEPVRLCPASCKPMGAMRRVYREVFCRNPNNVRTQAMVQECNVGILETTNQNTYTSLNIEVPTTCVPEI